MCWCLQVDGCAAYRPQLWLDGANGVGALKMRQMLQHLQGLLSVNIFNDGSSGKLNDLVRSVYGAHTAKLL